MREIGCAMVGAVCIQITNDCKLESRGGFKSGQFVTRGWQGIRWQTDCKGINPTGVVGHHEKHWMFWELGHHNSWTRQYERNQWLTRGFQRNTGAQDRVAGIAARVTAAKHSVSTSAFLRKP